MVTSLEDVREVLNQVLLEPGNANASHVVHAYRFQEGDMTVENFDSDGDHGLGLELLKTIRSVDAGNVMCVTIRKCRPNFKHLSKKRFQYVRETATEVINSL